MSKTKNTVNPASSISKKASEINELSSVYNLVEGDFKQVNALIPMQLSSDVDLVEEISTYIVESGGKRLRPLMVLLTAGALKYNSQKHIYLAAIIEFLHTATLLHDDVVDHSDMRRGKLTANEKWGNAPSVLVGDFLYSRAFQLMVEVGSLEIMEVLARATNVIAEGEVLQLTNVGNLHISEAKYREVIRCKTALLFEAATHTGAILSQLNQPNSVSDEQVQAMQQFGQHFGVTYQLVDDWLDYAGDAATMGKNVGDDFAEGKLTLPLIFALQHGTVEDKKIITDAINNRSAEQLPQIQKIVSESGALDYTHNAAVAESKHALQCLAQLPSGPYTDALTILTEYCTARLF